MKCRVHKNIEMELGGILTDLNTGKTSQAYVCPKCQSRLESFSCFGKVGSQKNCEQCSLKRECLKKMMRGD